jgi:hypothetical protein
MVKTYKSKTYKSKTYKSKTSVKHEEKIITKLFLEILLMIKLFHWKTSSYATHKATDELYSSLNENIDKFIEVLLGKLGTRIDLTNIKTISLIDLNSQEQLKSKINYFKNYLNKLTNNTKMNSSDLLNIRDEILADLNQFLYLLTFK